MGVDQLVTGGDVDDPVVDSFTTEVATVGGRRFKPFDDFDQSESFDGVTSITLDGFSYDTVEVKAIVNNPNGGDIGLRFNGDESNSYSWIRADGSKSGDTLLNWGGGLPGISRGNILLSADSGGATFDVTSVPAGATADPGIEFTPDLGYNDTVTGPITQVTLINKNGNEITGEVAVDGRDA